MGAFIGDAAGAHIEFKFKITEQMVDDSVAMNGGGSWDTGRGQITDDSEIAMCIMHGLTDPEARAESASSRLNLDGITYYFGQWKRDAFGKSVLSLID